MLSFHRPHSKVGRYTFHYHIRASLLLGIATGLIGMNEFIAKKALNASEKQITFLMLAPVIFMLMSSVFSSLMAGRDKKPFFLASGLLGGLFLVFVYFANTPFWFTVLVATSSLSGALLVPAQNAIFQSNYTPLERGNTFGVASAIGAITIIPAAFIAGKILEWRESTYHYIYPVAGVFVFMACYYYFRIRARNPKMIAQEKIIAVEGNYLKRAVYPFLFSYRVLTEHRDFLFFEVCFFIYGAAFMIMQPILPVFLVEEFNISYDQAASAKMIIFQVMMVLFTPLFGKLCDKWNPVILSSYIFAFLALFPVTLVFATGIKSVYLSYLIYGLTMSGVHITWTLGPLFFAHGRDSSSFMGVHATLVGIRGIIFLPLGDYLEDLFGPRAAFMVAAALFATASILMFILNLKIKKHMADGNEESIKIGKLKKIAAGAGVVVLMLPLLTYVSTVIPQ